MSQVKSNYHLNGVEIHVEVDEIAKGVVSMFTDNEVIVGRFGMLPAKKVELLEATLRGKLGHMWDDLAAQARELLGVDSPSTVPHLKMALDSEWSDRWGEKRREEALKDLTRQITRDVTVRMLSHMNLVV